MSRIAGAAAGPPAPSVATFRVPGIHCDGCLAGIGQAVADLPGVTLRSADAATKTVSVAYDATRTPLTRVTEALATAGFPVQASPRPARPGLVLLSAAGLATVLAVAGYLAGFGGFIYGVMLPKAFDRLGTVAVGAIAGTAAFFSPCVFPLLPGYVSYCLAGPADSPDATASPARWAPALRAAGAAAAGVMVVDLVIFGVIAVAGAASPFTGDIRDESAGVLAVRFVAGAVIAAMGARALLAGGRGSRLLARVGAVAGRTSSTRRTKRRRRPTVGSLLYGVTYNAAGLGCTGPILLGIMLYYALISEQALLVFATFTLTMGGWMFAVTIAAATARHRLIGRLRQQMSSAQRAGGAVMVVIGVYTMAIQSFAWGRELFVRVFTRYVL